MHNVKKLVRFLHNKLHKKDLLYLTNVLSC